MHCRIAHLRTLVWLLAGAWLAPTLVGCAAFPDISHQPQIHNPFPQFHKVAVLPFYNQSADPHVNQDEIALAYYNELQQIPGFEVMPVGTAKRLMETHRFEPRSGSDFQKLAQTLGVDAVIVGSVTEFTPYYPPRLGLSVNWYAANPGFHKIPVGYGLPWGTAEEEYIPSSLVREAEFELAREQLKTQTPELPPEFQQGLSPPEEVTPPAGTGGGSGGAASPGGAARRPRTVERASGAQPAGGAKPAGGSPSSGGVRQASLTTEILPTPMPHAEDELPDPPPAPPPPPGIQKPNLPPDWPDPRGFVPPAPEAKKPEFTPNFGPVITHTKLYDGHDADFTEALSKYYYFRDDARFGGWQGYLQRTPDFLRFCCHLHITETLAGRGGAGESRVVWRWPIGRYER